MALIKDGTIYRTTEEQLIHLTDVHRTQLTINQDVQQALFDLGIATNLGGYNLVRFAFSKNGTFYKVGSAEITVLSVGEIGDYVEISSNNKDDIPAYGYYTAIDKITILFAGDFLENYVSLAFYNVTKNIDFTENVILTEFTGTALRDYNPNDVKKQIFNVLSDLRYNCPTQYVSFDLNRDGIYSFVYLGAIAEGVNGKNIYTTNGTDFETKRNIMLVNDLILISDIITPISILPTARIGDIYEYISFNEFNFKCNIKGETGNKGDVGNQGIQGIQGIQGVQGIQGIKGDKGDKGDAGNAGLKIFAGILNSPAELPVFSTATVGDAYRIINTSESVVTYDLYFKTFNGIDWDLQPNWGGIKGDKGDKGDVGEQGIQGIQGLQGIQGNVPTNVGLKYINTLNCNLNETKEININDLNNLHLFIKVANSEWGSMSNITIVPNYSTSVLVNHSLINNNNTLIHFNYQVAVTYLQNKVNIKLEREYAVSISFAETVVSTLTTPCIIEVYSINKAT